MTINFTQFVNAYISAFPDNVADPAVSRWVSSMDREVRYGVQQRKVEEILLDDSDSATITIPGLASSQWVVFVIRCIGQGVLTTTGNDSASSPITGKTPIYGTSILPGILVLSTYNLTAVPTITSQADGSIFEVYTSICVEDS